MSDLPKSVRIGLVAYRGAQKAALYGLADVFDVAARHASENGAGRTLVQAIVPAEDPETLDLAGHDILILPPNLSGARGAADTALRAALRRRHAEGAVIASVCAGAFWLGHAGLLDGRPATTQWLLEDEFREAFPKVRLATERILIDDHDIVTAGGIMAWIDLGLHLVARTLGSEVASLTMRHLLIDPVGREQRNYRSFRPVLGHGDDRIRQLQLQMEQAPEGDWRVAAMADRAGMSERTLARRFAGATGLTPNAYVRNLRIEKARGLIENSRLPVAGIAEAVGYSDLSAFAKTFQEITGLTASAYRKRFALGA
ncbi:GlxA family transcriptional regulator [Hoeflea olei]|uniref:HTH araC/xylS-type domain-containing protein n=1 Tax=Hoeflea olei TaxID=1480615 RepID=A0A1C1YY02_9HYPH|nr:helix-turn-helix domain-containing protein [Hoeflea olei]OCW58443.1 hypothetical protein AWJ14_18245 [Hoeflea olei]